MMTNCTDASIDIIAAIAAVAAGPGVGGFGQPAEKGDLLCRLEGREGSTNGFPPLAAAAFGG